MAPRWWTAVTCAVLVMAALHMAKAESVMEERTVLQAMQGDGDALVQVPKKAAGGTKAAENEEGQEHKEEKEEKEEEEEAAEAKREESQAFEQEEKQREQAEAPAHDAEEEKEGEKQKQQKQLQEEEEDNKSKQGGGPDLAKVEAEAEKEAGSGGDATGKAKADKQAGAPGTKNADTKSDAASAAQKEQEEAKPVPPPKAGGPLHPCHATSSTDCAVSFPPNSVAWRVVTDHTRQTSNDQNEAHFQRMKQAQAELDQHRAAVLGGLQKAMSGLARMQTSGATLSRTRAVDQARSALVHAIGSVKQALGSAENLPGVVRSPVVTTAALQQQVVMQALPKDSVYGGQGAQQVQQVPRGQGCAHKLRGRPCDNVAFSQGARVL